MARKNVPRGGICPRRERWEVFCMKKMICVLLAAAMLLCAAPLAGFMEIDWTAVVPAVFHPQAKAAEVIASGRCGAMYSIWNAEIQEYEPADYPVYWSLDEDGVLTIRGNGKMADWWTGRAPW